MSAAISLGDVDAQPLDRLGDGESSWKNDSLKLIGHQVTPQPE
jgi:hypothetical protein